MMLRRTMVLGALAAGFLLAAGTSSQAAYSYSTSITIGSISNVVPAPISSTFLNTPGTGAMATVIAGGGTSIVNFVNESQSGVSSAVPSTVNIGALTISTNAPGPVSFNVIYTDVVTITNGGQSGAFTINGTLSLSSLTSTAAGGSGGQSTNLYNGTFLQTQSIGGISFTMNFGNGIVNDFYGPPSVNGPSGSIGANINPVPEPASLALLATGLAGLLGVGLHRRRKRLNPSP